MKKIGVLSSSGEVRQPDVYKSAPQELHVAIASLSLGGAERIVLDWAERIYPRWRVHLIVLRNRNQEWPVPSFVRVTRLGGNNLPKLLEHIGAVIAKSSNPVCVCHLLSIRERRALSDAGVTAIPVFHNAKSGWAENAHQIVNAPYAVAVSQSCADELKEDGWPGSTTVIRHIPKVLKNSPDVRSRMRRAWNIPENALVIGMIGAVKPQKDYVSALQIFREFLARGNDAYLVIIGGPVNMGIGKETWNNVVEQVSALGVRHRVAMPGFIADATRVLSVFDVMFNSSHFEGLSIATLEALLAGLPVVASQVGGQGEISHDSLHLVSKNAHTDVWVDALEKAVHQETRTPAWLDFPSYRLWTLVGIARPVRSSSKTLFVTANLNAGGAQRSLVNLAKSLRGEIDFELMVAGKSSATHFHDELVDAGVRVLMAGKRWDAFDYAEAIADKIVREDFGTVCFWNVDARIKLLLLKVFGFSRLRFIDVSPGGYSFEEIEKNRSFQELTAFSENQYFQRLDHLVLKYDTTVPGYNGEVTVIRNGVPESQSYKTDYRIQGNPKVVVSGRIAPTKFLIEIVAAMRVLWVSMPEVELHLIGAAEHYHQDYHEMLLVSIGTDLGKKVFFHGQNFDVTDVLSDFDVYLVLGKNQGCPNALLEALMAGLPVIGNNDGGTQEQIIDGVTGMLIEDLDPVRIADALNRVICDRAFAEKLGRAGRERVIREFSMELMTSAYLSLLLDVDVSLPHEQRAIG